MTSAIELSVKFGIPLKRVEDLCKFLAVPLDKEEFDVGKEFAAVARAVKRGRSSASTLAFLCDTATDEQREFILNLDEGTAKEYNSLGLPIVASELFPGGKALLDRLNASDASAMRSEWLAFAEWVKEIIQAAGSDVGHSYIAVRLLLSLPPGQRIDYAAPIASILNKARHRGYLADWFRVEDREGRNVVVYLCPAIEAKPPIMSEDELAHWHSMTAERDVTKLAGFIAFNAEKDFGEIKKFLDHVKKHLTFRVPLGHSEIVGKEKS